MIKLFKKCKTILSDLFTGIRNKIISIFKKPTTPAPLTAEQSRTRKIPITPSSKNQGLQEIREINPRTLLGDNVVFNSHIAGYSGWSKEEYNRGQVKIIGNNYRKLFWKSSSKTVELSLPENSFSAYAGLSCQLPLEMSKPHQLYITLKNGMTDQATTLYLTLNQKIYHLNCPPAVRTFLLNFTPDSPCLTLGLNTGIKWSHQPTTILVENISLLQKRN